MQYICEKCGKGLSAEDIGYLGPRDRSSERCDPFQDMECVCKECEFGLSILMEETT